MHLRRSTLWAEASDAGHCGATLRTSLVTEIGWNLTLSTELFGRDSGLAGSPSFSESESTVDQEKKNGEKNYEQDYDRNYRVRSERSQEES